ncbi:M23 family metallopeptidase [Micrococcales bacterium 31B]|nr:M23 family metallopeptidase [Micrococcales bacterium 31B]
MFSSPQTRRFARTAAVTALVASGLATTIIPAKAAILGSQAVDIIKVSYSGKLYNLQNGVPDLLVFSEWAAMGYPAARTVGQIPGTVYKTWATSPDIIATPPGDSPHKLTFAEWNAAGQPAPIRYSNEGFIKLSWAPEIARMTNLQTGAGVPLSFAQWGSYGFPSYKVQQRITGDQFYKLSASSPDIYYAGPAVNRKITLAEWVGAGKPTPYVRTSSAWGLIKPVDARVTSEFSLARMHPTLGYIRPHLGIDLGASCGTPIKASRAGVISSSTYDSGGGYSVTISHGIVNGVPLYTRYLHMRAPGLASGTRVNQGTIVGYVGTTGSSTGCHLHFEVKPNNQAQNPRNYLTF